MTGTLARTTVGLILAEPCDNTPAAEGWGQSIGGSTQSGVAVSQEAAHSGSNSWDFQIAPDWSPSAYIQLTKSVTIPTGGHPLIRCFRGLNVKGASYDDFLGTSLNQFGNRWTGAAAVANSLVTVSNTPSTDTPIASVATWAPSVAGQRIRLCARFQFASGFKPTFGAFAHGGKAGDGTYGGVTAVQGNANPADTFQMYSGGAKAGDSTWLCGIWGLAAVDANMHVYEVEWDMDPTFSPNDFETQIFVDGVQCYPYPGSAMYIGGYLSTYCVFERNAGPDNLFLVDFLSASFPSAYMCSLTLGSQTLFNNDAASDYGSALPVANDFFDECNGWAAVTVTGTQTLTIKVMNSSSWLQPFPVHIFWDDIMIMNDKTIIVNGLLGGQKVEFYNSGGTLLFSGICTVTGNSVTLASDVTPYLTSAYGLLGYFKVYSTDGTTLLVTTTTAAAWGGDVYTWLPNQSAASVVANVNQVYVSGSGLTPTSAIVTVTLVDAITGNPLASRAVTFTPNCGTCSPASATTNASGVASTTFTAGSTPGLGGVFANFAGDSTYGPSAAQQIIDVYLTTIVIDPAKGFQVFIEGQEIVASAGNYMLSTQFTPQSFEVDTPIMATYAIGGWWLVQIYRFGVLEFVGRIQGRKRQSGTTPTTAITGVDNKILLQRRLVNNGYTDDPKNIINDLLTQYPCGISPGTLVSYGNTINLVASYEILADALAQIQTDTGWLFRLNTNGTLDFASSFGALPNVSVILGQNAIMTEYEEDWSQLDTSVTAVGAGTGASLLVQQVSNPAASLIYGLIEAVSLQKSIATPGALALAAQQILAAQSQTRITITVDFSDMNPTATYNLWDYITVTDKTTGLSGIYQIYSIKRDLTNANYAELVLTNVVIGMADILALVRSNVKDLSL